MNHRNYLDLRGQIVGAPNIHDSERNDLLMLAYFAEAYEMDVQKITMSKLRIVRPAFRKYWAFGLNHKIIELVEVVERSTPSLLKKLRF